jgi:hypothetical protein
VCIYDMLNVYILNCLLIFVKYMGYYMDTVNAQIFSLPYLRWMISQMFNHSSKTSFFRRFSAYLRCLLLYLFIRNHSCWSPSPSEFSASVLATTEKVSEECFDFH